MARDGSGPPADRRPRRSENKLEWLERTGDGTRDGASDGTGGGTGEETSLFASVPPMTTPTPPMTRREARAREQAEQTAVPAAAVPAATVPAATVPTATVPTAAVPAAAVPSPQSLVRDRTTAAPRSAAAIPRGTPRGTAPGPAKNPVTTAVLLLAAFALLAWAGVSFVSAPLPGTHLLAAAAPLVTVLALPVIALSAGRRNLVSGVLAGLAAVVPWTVVAGYAAEGPGPTVAGSSSTSLRLMFLDASEASADPTSITAVARGQGVDVVVMTGLSDAFSHDLAVAGLNRLVTPRWVSTSAGRADGIGVWSRQGTATLELVQGTKLPVGQGLLTTPAGTVDLVVAQLPGSVLTPGAGWRDQLQQLGRLPALTRDRVLVGDLNATPWNPAFRSFTGKTWHDAADIVGRGLRPTWPAWSPLPVTPTDHVLVSAGIGASAADTVRVRGTSHRAMIVTLLVPK